MDKLNIFDVREITSLPDPEEPDPSIDYFVIDDRFNLLELNLINGATSIDVAIELKEILLSSIWKLLEDDCNFLEHTSGIRLVREFIRIDNEGNPVYELPNSEAEQIKTSPKLSMTLILRNPNPNINEDDLLSGLDTISFIASEPISDSPSIDPQGYAEIFDNNTYSMYLMRNKLTNIQKLAIWKLIYALFYYQSINHALEKVVTHDASYIIIPLNNAEDQISILKKLLNIGSYNSKLLDEYTNLELITHISTHRSDLKVSDLSLDDPEKHILTSLLYINEDLLLAITKSYGMGGNDFPDELIKFVTYKYIGL